MGPLRSLRVLDLSLATVPLAGKLLAELGADVVGRADVGADGAEPAAAPGPFDALDWWFAGGTRRVALDLDDAASRDGFRALVAAADVLLESEPPGRLEALGLGPAALAGLNPRLVHISTTPFGATGPRAAWRSSDLVASALGGWLSVTGLPDEPVAIWGRQSSVAAGFYAAVAALAGVARRARLGRGLHLDLSTQQAVLSCTEHLLMHWWYPQILAPFGAPIAARQGSLHWVRGYVVVACRRGWCMVSPTAGGVPDLLAWMRSEGFALDIPSSFGPGEALAYLPAIMAELAAFALTMDAEELFLGGQARHVPFGLVRTIPEVVACPQLGDRGFFRPVEGQPDVRIPGPLCRFGASPVGPPIPPPSTVTPVAEVVAGWPPAAGAPPLAEPSTGAEPAVERPLAGVRVLDFTHVLAGPFATRVLADLGADVIRLQTESRSLGASANDFPYYAMWNRNKRSATLNMKHAGALDVLRRLVEQADVVIDNFSAGVLAEWGAGPDVLASWNPAIVSIAMTGAGESGPWRDFVTFAPTVHALCGLTALTGPAGGDRLDCGPGIAFNDHASGLAGALAILAALEDRRASGRGQHIDLSQLEVASYLVGPALVDYLAGGPAAVALGTADAFEQRAVDDVVRCADGEWLAVSSRDEAPVLAVTGGRPLAEWAATIGAFEAAEALQAGGVAAGAVQNAAHLTERDPQLAARDWLVHMDSPLWGGSQPTDRFPGVLHDGPSGAEIRLEYVHSPAFGEHTFEVYGELLGWGEDQVAEAIADGLFG